MPGMPLFNLGNVLAGLTQGYNQAKQQGAQQALQALALQMQQRQNAAQSLAGLGLSSGLLGNTGSSPMQAINAPTPPMPGQPSVPSPSATSWPGQSAGAPPPAVPVGTTNPPPPGYVPPPDATPAPQNMPPPPSTAAAAGAAGFPEGGASLPDDSGYEDLKAVQRASQSVTKWPPAPPSGGGNEDGGPAASSTPTVSSPGSESVNTGSTAFATLPNGNQISIPDMFQSLDTTKVAQGLARLAPPGTDPATIYEATADLLKLAQGNKEQQIQAGLLAKALGAQVTMRGQDIRAQTQERGQDITSQGQATRAATAARGQDIGLQKTQMNIAARQQIADASNQIKEATQARIDRNAKARLDQGAARLQQQAQNANANLISKQIVAVRAQMGAVKAQPDGSYTDDQQKQLAGYAQQLQTLGAQLQKMAEQPAASP